ncbi:MAG: hypothetical protein EAZ53_02935 [Bacteroidetes bacterium]|nr:MAG: hypothetical protein EAZ53_02935 [Bacteroidota bacterium]
MNAWFNVVMLSSFFLAVFGIGEIAFRKFKVDAELTRKWSHIASGFLALLFPYFFKDVGWVILICTIFAIFLFTCKYFGFLPSINAVKRKTHGSILFPLAVIISFISYEYQEFNLLYYYLPVLTLAVCDLCAAIIGKKYPLKSIKIYLETKSLGGFLAFLFSFILLNLSFIILNFQIPLVFILIGGLFSAGIELISPRGFDNITIPLSVIVSMYYLL